MHKRFESLLNWYRTHTLKANLIALAAVILIGGALIAASIFSGVVKVDRTSTDTASDTPDAAVQLVPSSTTAHDITQSANSLPVIGVLMSNSKEARPQSGMDQADIVFEAIAEGGITRYLALFHDHQPKFIGPVRSLRPYYIDFAQTFNAFVAHVGGSPRALKEAKSELGSRDLNQFSIGTRAFERVNFRGAPHNVYTNYDKLRTVAGSAETSNFTSLLRKEGEPLAQPTAKQITVNYSSAAYNTSWSYNAEKNNYRRSLGGAPHLDRETKQQLTFDVVVVLKSNYSQFVEGGTSYNDIATKGSGTAFIFQDGGVTEATWTKESDTTQYKLTANGEDLALNRGSIWFAVQPTGQTTRYE